MALGKNYEIAHQYPSEELTSTELWAEREAAVARLGETAMYLCSVSTMFREAQDAGNIPQGLWEASTSAQVDNIAAMEWLMDVNVRIREAGL